MNPCTLIFIATLGVALREVNGKRDHLKLLADHEIRRMELQDKSDHEMIVNQAFSSLPGPSDDDHHFNPQPFEARNGHLRRESTKDPNKDTGHQLYEYDETPENEDEDETTGVGSSTRKMVFKGDPALSQRQPQKSPSNSQFNLEINPKIESCFGHSDADGNDQGEESRQIKVSVSTSGLEDVTRKFLKRLKRNTPGHMTPTSRGNEYQVNPETDGYSQHHQHQHYHQQQQNFQQQQSQAAHQPELQHYEHILGDRNNPTSDQEQLRNGERSNRNPIENQREHSVQFSPSQLMLPNEAGKRPTSGNVPDEREEEMNRGPKYEFNYDIPKDSFQSDVINGQFSTFAKLPMSFESLIQSDASFLDSLSENPPDALDKSVSYQGTNVNSNMNSMNPSNQRDYKSERVNIENPMRPDAEQTEPDYDSEPNSYPMPPAQPMAPQQHQQSPQLNPRPFPPNPYEQSQHLHGRNSNYEPHKHLNHQPQANIISSPSIAPKNQPEAQNFYHEEQTEQPEMNDYLMQLRPVFQQRPIPISSHQNEFVPVPRRAPFRGLIRQASRAFQRPYTNGFLERSAIDQDEPVMYTRATARRQRYKFQDYFDPSEQRMKDRMMNLDMYKTTTPPPPPPQKVVNAQLQVIKNGAPVMPSLPKQLSINYVSGPPPPPPPDPYYTTTPAPPPPQPPPSFYRKPGPMYQRLVNQQMKYTTTPPPPPPSKIIQFGLNFSQTLDQPIFVGAPKDLYAQLARGKRSINGNERKARNDGPIDEDDCERSSPERIPDFCSTSSDYPREQMRRLWNPFQIDQMLKKENTSLEKLRHEFKLNSAGLIGQSSNDNANRNSCTSHTLELYPLKARNSSGFWKFLVNDEEMLKQQLIITKCAEGTDTSKEVCDSERSAAGTCGQSYTLKSLITFDPVEKSFQVDSFDIPTFCNCLEHFTLNLW